MIRVLIAMLLVGGAAQAQSADQAIADAKAKIAMKMKDPESARFSDVVLSPKGDVVCGWVNAKNSYGGYVGYKPFFVMGKFAEVRDDEDGALNNRGTFAMLWRGCGLLPEGESFGDVLVNLPKINVPKQCEKNRKTAGRPELYANCEAREAEAFTWLQGHTTGNLIAFKCEQDVRRYSSYLMGKSCVESREANEVMDRGPRAVGTK